MIILALVVFTACCWAIFSKHFCDGIVTKHFLAFSAITAMIVVRDPSNVEAMVTSGVLFIMGVAYWFFKHQRQIRQYLSINH